MRVNSSILRSKRRIPLLFGLIASLFLALLFWSTPANAVPPTTHVSDGATSVSAPMAVASPLLFIGADTNVNTTASDQEIVCVGGALGYITCPLLDMSADMIRFIAILLDVVFNFQALNNESIRGVWGIFTNLANIALAVVFMVIVVSQTSSIGISSYGVKRMLPRVVAAAILINMSFFVCALAIDISNVLGSNMMGFIGTLTQDELIERSAVAQSNPACQVIGESVGRSGVEVWSWISPAGWASRGLGWNDNIEDAAGSAGRGAGAVGGLFGLNTQCKMAVVAVGLMGGVSVITVIIAIILIAVFIAFITTVALAFMRYVLLIFLVILAPLAFAAWVLPGTESLFKKWWSLFYKLLIIYPAAMFMFGASMFAASVVGAVVSEGSFVARLFPDSNITQEMMDAVWAALQLFIIAMPLFFIPKLFKSMDSITGGLAGKMAAMGSGAGLYRMGKRSAKTGAKMGVKAATPYAKYGAIRATDKIADGNGAFSGVFRKARAHNIAVRTTLAARKEGIEQLAKEEALKIGASSPGMQKAGGDRFQQILRSQKSKDYSDRVKNIASGYTEHKDNHEFLEQEFFDAYRKNDGAQAEAVLDTLHAGGNPGMSKSRSLLKAVQEQKDSQGHALPMLTPEIGGAINNSTDKSYQGLISKRADVAKGRAGVKEDGVYRYELGTVGEAGTSQIATHSAGALYENYESIPREEAQTILNSEQLDSTVPDTKARGVLKIIAEGKPKPASIDKIEKVPIATQVSQTQAGGPRIPRQAPPDAPSHNDFDDRNG